LVKHFFSPHLAGLYSGLSLVGKVIFYFTAPITTVLFPLVIKKYHQGTDFLKTFYLALGLVFVPSVAISVFYFLFPKFTIYFFLGGNDYLKLIPYVGLYSVFLVVFCLLNITVTFLLSLKRTSVIIPMIIGSVSQIVCIYLFHKNFYQVIYSGTIVTSVLLVAILLYYVRNYESKKTQKTAPIVINNPNL
jgi:O-antigen/teichoic acid export membrane protein